MPEYHIGIVGDHKTGKTTLRRRLSNKKKSLIGKIRRSKETQTNFMIIVDNEHVNISISEINVIDRHNCMKYDAFFLLFDVTSPETFKSLQTIKTSLEQHAPNSKIIILANKCDCEDNRQISNSDIIELASKWCCPFYEICAKQNSTLYSLLGETAENLYTFELRRKSMEAIPCYSQQLVVNQPFSSISR